MKLQIGYKSALPTFFIIGAPTSFISYLSSNKFEISGFPFSQVGGGGMVSEISNSGTNHDSSFKRLEILEGASNRPLKSYTGGAQGAWNISDSSEEVFRGIESGKDKEMTGVVDNLLAQVNLEEGALKIDKEAVAKYSNYTTGLQKHQESFKNGLHIVQEFQQSQNGKRAKRTTEVVKEKKILSLNKQNRQAIKKFYEIFDKLSEEERGLWMKINDLSGKNEKSKHLFDPPYKLQDVLVGLRRIGWENEKVELVSKSLSRKRLKPTIDNWYGWGSWDQSPWKYFFKTAEEWKSKIFDVERSKQALEKYLKSKRGCVFSIVLGQWGVNQCYSEKSKFENQLAASEEAISLHIAAWMLQQMNLLNHD